MQTNHDDGAKVRAQKVCVRCGGLLEVHDKVYIAYETEGMRRKVSGLHVGIADGVHMHYAHVSCKNPALKDVHYSPSVQHCAISGNKLKKGDLIKTFFTILSLEPFALNERAYFVKCMQRPTSVSPAKSR